MQKPFTNNRRLIERIAETLTARSLRCNCNFIIVLFFMNRYYGVHLTVIAIPQGIPITKNIE